MFFFRFSKGIIDILNSPLTMPRIKPPAILAKRAIGERACET